MKNIIGVIGSRGDLGSQLVNDIRAAGYEVLCYDRRDHNAQAKLIDIKQRSEIIHLTIPASAVKDFALLNNSNAIIILHDSVMATSQRLSRRYFDSDAGIVHMLMNQMHTVVIAKNDTHQDALTDHFTRLSKRCEVLSIDEHDSVMAASQAPLALLVKTIHKPLKQYKAAGLLTPSGEELADTLDARSAVWTDATMASLLQNPKLQDLIKTMQAEVVSVVERENL